MASEVVGADGEDDVHELLLVELGGEHGPGGVADPGVGQQLVDGGEQRGVERRPSPAASGPCRDPRRPRRRRCPASPASTTCCAHS